MSGSEIITVAVQLCRYASVGVSTNITSYLLYLCLTRLGLQPMIAATIAFIAAVVLSFALNRNVTFRNLAHPRGSLRRYVIAYAIAYGADVSGLYVFVSLIGYPHESVQLALIVFIACGLFVAQKWWVFAGRVDHNLGNVRGQRRAADRRHFAMDTVVTIDGIRCYAPTLALGTEDYPAELYDRLCGLEERHFWFRARNRIILREFRRYLGHLSRPSVIEIGCGTGYVLQALATQSRYKLTGAEAHIAGLRHARVRLPSVEFVQADARDLPYEAAFDAVGAFDVIEHITEDERVLASVYRALKPGGVLIATVPQHKWLWSWTDEQARHKRRYGRQELCDKIRAAGFDMLRATSFMTTLLPALYVSRLAMKQPQSAASEIDLSELEITPTANAVCGAVMRMEETLIRAGVSLPVGSSLLAVARKNC
jgi:SAM-dependent methyltransferase/putative flippase GtrA